MPTSSNKPRDIKDLKARLGRTGAAGAPGQGGAPANQPGGSPVPPAAGGLPPPAVGGAYTGAPFPGTASPVPTPAFTQPGAPGRPGGPARSQPSAPGGAYGSAPPGRAVSPFDVMPVAPVEDRKVRIVIDDTAVKDAEIGRHSNIRNGVLIGVGLLLGVVAGFGVGNTHSERKQYNFAVQDGKLVYGRISEVSKVLETARASMKTAVEASQGGPGKQAHVDYKAVGELVALEKPFSAAEFSRRRYLAFPTAVVDDLFEYYNNVNLLWGKFAALGNRTTGTAAKEALDKSAQAGDQLVSQLYGMVVTKTDNAFVGGMVVVRPKPADAGKEAKDEAPIVLVSSRAGSREVERRMFLGQADFAEKPDTYVVLVDKARSMGLLGAGASLFGQLRADLVEAQMLLDKTTEIQGRLIKELGKIAALPEQWMF
jgi:hypothetical protein